MQVQCNKMRCHSSFYYGLCLLKEHLVSLVKDQGPTVLGVVQTDYCCYFISVIIAPRSAIHGPSPTVLGAVQTQRTQPLLQRQRQSLP